MGDWKVVGYQKPQNQPQSGWKVVKPAKAKPRNPIPAHKHAVGSLTDLASQGQSFGFADEIVAGLTAPVALAMDAWKHGGVSHPLAKLKKYYNWSLNDQRERVADARKRHGWVGTGVEIGGGLLTGGTEMAVLKSLGKSLAIKAASKQATKVMARDGALYGAGSGNADTLEGRVVDAGKGAVAGVVLGKTVQKGLQAGGASLRVLRNVARRTPFRRDADHYIKRALKADDVTPRQALDEFRSLKRPGQVAGMRDIPATLMDSAQSLKNLARDINTGGGEGGHTIERVLRGRQGQAQHDRVIDHLRRGMGLRGQPEPHQAKKIIEANSKQAAAPLYDRAFKEQQGVDFSKVAEHVDEAIGKEAAGTRALSILEKLRKQIDDVAPDGQMSSLEKFDSMKKDIDGRIGMFLRENGDKATGMKLSRLLKEARSHVDKTNSVYSQAREAARPGLQFKQAYKEGGRFVSDDVGVVADKISDFHPISQTGYRMGALEGLKKKIGGSKRSDYAGPISGPYPLDRLREIAAPQYREALPDAIRAERKLSEGTNWLHNSNTAQKIMGQANLQAQAGVVNQAAKGGLRGLSTAAVDSVLKGIAKRFDLTERHMSAVADILMERSPSRVEAHLQRIGRDMDNVKWQALRKYVINARMAINTGQMVGRFGGMKQEN